MAAVHLEGGCVEPTWWQQVLRVNPCVRAEGEERGLYDGTQRWFLGLGPSNQVTVTFSMTGDIG